MQKAVIINIEIINHVLNVITDLRYAYMQIFIVHAAFKKYYKNILDVIKIMHVQDQ